MRILITGASGQLGRELRNVLREDELLTPTHNEMDITDSEIVPKIIRLNPEFIIHSAAYTDVDGCEENPGIAWDVNSLGTENVATAAEEIKSKLVYISTDYVFDGRKKKPYIETDKPNPLNVYGETKLRGENLVKDICSRFCIIRTSWLYGKGGNNFVHTILSLSRERDELRVVNDQRGSPTYARDLAYTIKRLIPNDACGICHASGEGNCSWYDFAVRIVRMSGIDIKVVPISSLEMGRAAARPPYSVLRNSRNGGVKIFMRPWQEALKEFLS